MKITHNKIGQTLNLVDGAKSDKAGEIKTGPQKNNVGEASLFSTNGSDAAKVDVSSRAQDAQRIKELAMAAPDVDMQKVEKFRKLIDAGQYKVDAKSVADRMVDEHLDVRASKE